MALLIRPLASQNIVDAAECYMYITGAAESMRNPNQLWGSPCGNPATARRPDMSASDWRLWLLVLRWGHRRCIHISTMGIIGIRLGFWQYGCLGGDAQSLPLSTNKYSQDPDAESDVRGSSCFSVTRGRPASVSGSTTNSQARSSQLLNRCRIPSSAFTRACPGCPRDTDRVGASNACICWL